MAAVVPPIHNTSTHPVDLHDGADLPAAVGTPPGGTPPGARPPVALIHFHDDASPSQQVDQVLMALASTHAATLTVRIVRVAVAGAAAGDLVTRFGIDAVPTVVAVVGGGTGGVTVRGRVVGADVPALRVLADELVAYGTSAAAIDAPAAGTKTSAAPATVAAPSTPAAADKDKDDDAGLQTRLAALVRRSPVMLFMKGTPDSPRCGFSRQIVGLLRDTGVPFDTFDILGDPAVRAGLKTYAQWPTYPQLYVKGEFVGGLDVVNELASAGELAAELATSPSTAQTAVTGADVAPAGTAGAEAAATPNGVAPPSGVAPSGGDVPVAASAVVSTPATAVADNDDDAGLQTRLAALVRRSPVMLFMKGTPDSPRCGFSRQIVGLLRDTGVPFDTFDILGDPAVRAGLKTYAQWPTYPQLYVKGEFVGGLDVVNELASAGELAAELGVGA
ncbi:hypothetical protein MMPV_008805 [Pyropia vietnamensis]